MMTWNETKSYIIV